MFKTTLRLDALEAREVPAGLRVVTTGVAADVNLRVMVPGPTVWVVTTGIETNVNLSLSVRVRPPSTTVTGRPTDITQPPTGLQLTEPAGLTKPVTGLTGSYLGPYFG